MTQNRIILYLILFLWHPISLFSQTDSTNRPLEKKRLPPLIIGAGVAYTGTLIYLGNQWYSDYEKEPFHFFNDSKEWKQVDKVGHLYGAFQFNSISYSALRWSGLAKKKALLWSGVSAFVFMGTIEWMDGYSSGYGASATDLLANSLGIGLFQGQMALWKEIRIQPKFSFTRSPYASARPEILGSGFAEELLKDYNGQTYWLSFDLNEMGIKKIPNWLNIAVGYGANDMIYATNPANVDAGYNPYRQWYIGPDLDLTHINTRSKFLNTVIYFVNMIRIPSPALELSQGDIHWHWLK